MTNTLPSEILLYQPEGGETRIDVRPFDESVRSTQRLKQYIIKGFAMDDECLSQARNNYFDELVWRVRAIRDSELLLY